MLALEELDKYLKAGEIAAEVREAVPDVVDEGKKLIDICEWVEGRIRSLGGRPAFPCNVSVNEVAAHYTSPPGDEATIPPGAIVKVDLGVHVDGYIADTATTICLDPAKERLARASRAALEAALREMRPGIRISHVSSIIERTIRAYGCKPISNLTGHDLDRYTIHAGTAIPNVSTISLKKLRPGRAYAIEPFVTEPWGDGVVIEAPVSTIFRLVRPTVKGKGKRASELLRAIYNEFKTLPFAERWLWRLLPRSKYEQAWRELLDKGAVMSYPVFIERSRCPVAQFEHTVVVLEDKCIITTLPGGP
ncbi:MAG TPA: type II methionyl aminopeptidase [Candidatus Bathyarchaeota archaeon]|nr:type II methionyl aminopeptidase [Candidatus Bathyarchaeota archaeon]